MTASSPVVLAVVGAGGWGRNHVRNFAALPGAELRYVCDRSPEVRAAVDNLFPGVRVCEDLATVLEDGEVQAVVVASDASSHHELTRRALESGRDVLCEKPLTLSSASSAALCDLAEAQGRILMVGHLLLYHPAVTKLRSLIDQGELGEVLYLSSQRTNLGVVRRDENAWWSLAPHDLSLANYLLADHPESVSASGGVFLQPQEGIEDVVFATVAYPGGRLAHVHVSWLDPHKTRRLTVVGSRKMAVFDDTSPDQKLILFDKGVEPPPPALDYAQGVRLRTGDIIAPALKMAEPLKRECEAFLEAVRTRTPPLADGRSGASVVRILEAGSVSLREAGRRVDMNR
ncbi:MAG: Gfo/Idh/MocA family protein [Sandaracinaceae bacterium]